MVSPQTASMLTMAIPDNGLYEIRNIVAEFSPSSETDYFNF